MYAVRHRPARLAGLVFLLAVFCQPLFLGGHHHPVEGLRADATECSVCAVTAHVPALRPPAVPALGLALIGPAPALDTAPTPARPWLRVHGARAPPASRVVVA